MINSRPRTIDDLIEKVKSLIVSDITGCEIWTGLCDVGNIPFISYKYNKINIRNLVLNNFKLTPKRYRSKLISSCKNKRCVALNHINQIDFVINHDVSNIDKSDPYSFVVSHRDRIKRFLLDRVSFEPNSGCWIWENNTYSNGYGRAHIRPFEISTHRLSWMLFKGEINNDLHVCHKCDTRLCINPDHLFLGTNFDNMHDKIKKGRLNYPNPVTVCKHGHSFDEANTKYYFVNGKQHRACRSCSQKHTKESRLRRKLRSQDSLRTNM